MLIEVQYGCYKEINGNLDSIKELLDSGGSEMISGILFMLFTAIALVTLDATSFLIMLVSFIPLFFLPDGSRRTPESTTARPELLQLS